MAEPAGVADDDSLDECLGPQQRERANTWPRQRLQQYLEGEVAQLPRLQLAWPMELEEADQLAPEASSDQHQPPPAGRDQEPAAADRTGGAPAESGPAVRPKTSSRRNAWGPQSYADLITQAILSSPEKRLTLSQVYDWMVTNIEWFKDKGDSTSSAGWKNSIRHNLSLHSRFVKVQNEGTGKSSWWMVNPDASKTSKSGRRRATLETSKYEKRRGRAKKRPEGGGEVGASPASSLGEGLDGGRQPDSPLHLTGPGEFRRRANSAASSCGSMSPVHGWSYRRRLDSFQQERLAESVESGLRFSGYPSGGTFSPGPGPAVSPTGSRLGPGPGPGPGPAVSPTGSRLVPAPTGRETEQPQPPPYSGTQVMSPSDSVSSLSPGLQSVGGGDTFNRSDVDLFQPLSTGYLSSPSSCYKTSPFTTPPHTSSLFLPAASASPTYTPPPAPPPPPQPPPANPFSVDPFQACQTGSGDAGSSPFGPLSPSLFSPSAPAHASCMLPNASAAGYHGPRFPSPCPGTPPDGSSGYSPQLPLTLPSRSPQQQQQQQPGSPTVSPVGLHQPGLLAALQQQQQHLQRLQQQQCREVPETPSQLMSSLMGALQPNNMPVDLDLDTFQGGLDCDMDNIIKQELSMDGQLDFSFSQSAGGGPVSGQPTNGRLVSHRPGLVPSTAAAGSRQWQPFHAPPVEQ